MIKNWEGKTLLADVFDGDGKFPHIHDKCNVRAFFGRKIFQVCQLPFFEKCCKLFFCHIGQYVGDPVLLGDHLLLACEKATTFVWIEGPSMFDHAVPNVGWDSEHGV